MYNLKIVIWIGKEHLRTSSLPDSDSIIFTINEYKKMNRSLMNGTTAQNEFDKDKIHDSHEISTEEKSTQACSLYN